MFSYFALILMTLIASVTWQEEVKEVDKKINQLQDLRGRYKSSAQRNIDNAMRWQFQRENYMDARRAWDRAAQDKQKISEIQDHIDNLRKKRERILKEHGQATS